MSLRLSSVVLLAIALSGAALADGGFVPARATTVYASSAAAQKAVIISEPDSEVLLLQTTYRGPSSAFAWIIPVPEKPEAVFPANQHFVDGIFRETSPRLVDHLVAGNGGAGGGGRGGGMGGETAQTGPVQMLGRLTVGDYEAAILAARKAGGGDKADAVTTWLQDNGYEVSDKLGDVLQPYIDRDWVFVALKLQEKVAEQKPLLKDVAPVGIRFHQSARRLVFPLYISRLSAPSYTAIALAIVSTCVYRCRELPMVEFAKKRGIQPGQTYGAVRREMCRVPTPALLCEYCREGLSEPLKLVYGVAGRAPTYASLGGIPVVSRYFAYLQPKEMVDLNFVPRATSRRRDYEVLIERTATANWQDRHSDDRRWVSGAAMGFADTCGALPRQAADLLQPAALGWDASGNTVGISSWAGPYLKPQSWQRFDVSKYVFDPLNIIFCDRTDLTGTVGPATAGDCLAAGWSPE